MPPGTMRYTISPDAAFAAVDDGAVVLHMRTKRYYTLNESGAFVWQRLEDGLDRAAIVASVVDVFDVGASTAVEDVALLLEQLAEESLISAAPIA